MFSPHRLLSMSNPSLVALIVVRLMTHALLPGSQWWSKTPQRSLCLLLQVSFTRHLHRIEDFKEAQTFRGTATSIMQPYQTVITQSV